MTDKTQAQRTPGPMPFARVLRLVTRAAASDDMRKARRAFYVALRWTDANRAAGWDLGEYHAMRRRSVRQTYHMTARSCEKHRARAVLKRATGE